MFAWILYQYSCFLPQSKDMYGVRLSGDFKLLECEHLFMCLIGPAMGWQPVHDVLYLSPCRSWDRLQPPVALNWISGREWMEICMIDWLILICTSDCRKLRQSLICTDCMLIRVGLFYLLNCSNNQHFNIFILNRMLSLLFNRVSSNKCPKDYKAPHTS